MEKPVPSTLYVAHCAGVKSPAPKLQSMPRCDSRVNLIVIESSFRVQSHAPSRVYRSCLCWWRHRLWRVHSRAAVTSTSARRGGLQLQLQLSCCLRLPCDRDTVYRVYRVYSVCVGEIPKNLYQKQRTWTKTGKNQLQTIFFSFLGRAHRACLFGVEFVENYPYSQ